MGVDLSRPGTHRKPTFSRIGVILARAQSSCVGNESPKPLLESTDCPHTLTGEIDLRIVSGVSRSDLSEPLTECRSCHSGKQRKFMYMVFEDLIFR